MKESLCAGRVENWFSHLCVCRRRRRRWMMCGWATTTALCRRSRGEDPDASVWAAVERIQNKLIVKTDTGHSLLKHQYIQSTRSAYRRKIYLRFGWVLSVYTKRRDYVNERRCAQYIYKCIYLYICVCVWVCIIYNIHVYCTRVWLLHFFIAFIRSRFKTVQQMDPHWRLT